MIRKILLAALLAALLAPAVASGHHLSRTTTASIVRTYARQQCGAPALWTCGHVRYRVDLITVNVHSYDFTAVWTENQLVRVRTCIMTGLITHRVIQYHYTAC